MAGVADRTDREQPDTGREPVRLLGAGPRRWRWLAAGAGLMVLGALAVVTALGQVDQRSGIVAAARDLPAGHVVGAGDLQVAEIAGGESLAVIPAAQLDVLIGRTVLAPIGEDAPIAEGTLGADADHPGAGEAVVSASLADNRVPESLRSGAYVSLITTGQGEGDGGGDSADAEESAAASGPSEVIEARVQTVTPPGEGGEETRVELVVDGVDAAEVARAASADALAVVEVSGRGR
ncbi:hypothetical protein HDA32_005148 [Spinactinospora alkalitolerans]|uniref:SAF domain-containing protein n=1 Tax=Spinactinospora alkalitolerans TaxID=687207 RepID=A0A852U1C8_9ACTN|nr:SAF domain-containing protein [Spinactinospora alkalitolerans]NYE50028.1 hypothetical protein [Spinactinospora alkalitolerans]